MPRIKRTKTNLASASTGQATHKGPASGKRKTGKSNANVAEMIQTMNSKTSDVSSSSGPARRPVSRGTKKNASRSSDDGTDGPGGRARAAGGKGKGRGRAGRDQVTERTPAKKDRSQTDDRTVPGSGVKRKKMLDKDQQEVPEEKTTGDSAKQRQRTAQRKILDDDDFLERQISAQSVAKWQTMTKTSQDFVHQIIDSAISVVLNETSGSSYDGIQDHLNNLKRRLMTSFMPLKVPNKRQPKYREMESHTQILEAALVETSNQVECLDKEVLLQEQLLEQKEEELEKLEAAAQQDEDPDNVQETTKRLHPSLRDDKQDVLGLPPLRRPKHNLSLHQLDDVRGSSQQPALEALRRWNQSQEEGVSEVTDFIDALSALQASLP